MATKHVADAQTRVSEQWLLAVGFTKSFLPHLFNRAGCGLGGEITVGVTMPEEGMEEADSLWVNGELVCIEPTRGRVRLLLRALGEGR